MTKLNKTLTPFEYDMRLGRKPEEHTFEITDELVDRLKFNTGYQVTPASRKVIKYGIEQFTINRHPFQIFYAIKALEHSKVWNVAMNAMIIHFKYLLSWRYFFKLISKHPHHFSDLVKLAVLSNSDVGDVFIKGINKVYDHKSYIAFMWTVRPTLDIDEMFDLNDCMAYWKKYHESKNDVIFDNGLKQIQKEEATNNEANY